MAFLFCTVLAEPEKICPRRIKYAAKMSRKAIIMDEADPRASRHKTERWTDTHFTLAQEPA
jgi:hypothetical protein